MMIRSIGRGRDKTYGRVSQKYDSLSKFFAETVTGKFNQDISFLMVGKKGTGKSYCQLSLAYHTSCEIAEIMGGQWSDYFDMESNMAIIDPEKANQIMGKQDKYAVKIYDDIGIGWGARNWQDQENKAKNDIFQINRVDNQVQMFSVPNQFLLDKVPRSLVSHYAETYSPHFKKGFVTIKMFEPQTMFRQGKIIQPYLAINRQKYIMYAIPEPPSELSIKYREMRTEVTNRIVQMRKEQILNGDAEIKKKKSSRQDRMHHSSFQFVKRTEELLLLGESFDRAWKTATKELKLPEATCRNWIKRGEFEYHGVNIVL
jgi:hypothetical protein